MQICTLEFPSVSFGRANALEHCKQCKHSNDVAAHFQMLPTLKREEKKTPSILRIRGKPLHKVFFSSWKKSLERFETSPPDYLIVSTINHRLPETFRPSKFCNAHQRLWPTMTNASLKLCFCKGTLGRMTFRKPLSEYYLKRSGWEVKACESDFSRDNFSNN